MVSNSKFESRFIHTFILVHIWSKTGVASVLPPFQGSRWWPPSKWLPRKSSVWPTGRQLQGKSSAGEAFPVFMNDMTENNMENNNQEFNIRSLLKSEDFKFVTGCDPVVRFHAENHHHHHHHHHPPHPHPHPHPHHHARTVYIVARAPCCHWMNPVCIGAPKKGQVTAAAAAAAHAGAFALLAAVFGPSGAKVLCLKNHVGPTPGA